MKYNKKSLPELVGKGYGTFWRFKGRYRVVKGSRASKKSKTTALWYITNLVKYPGSNLLVIRKTERTLKDSCYSDLKWAIHRLGLDSFFNCKISPLEIVYKPTGQKILFRGLDDPLKVTSISVDTGYLCWCWIEEAYEITDETSFDMLDESIRGELPDGLFKQITLTFNPWSEMCWIKKRFFDAAPNPDILCLTTNYMCNEWLDKADLSLFERMKTENPRRYQVAGLGNWGVSDGLVYENWIEQLFNHTEVAGTYINGLDFGYKTSPSAFIALKVDSVNKLIYVFDEFYETGLTNPQIYKKLVEVGFAKEKIVADCAEPKSITELRDLGARNIVQCRKGSDSVDFGIQLVSDYKIIIHPTCVNTLREISLYCFDKDKFGKTINKPVKENDHLMDALRYAVMNVAQPETFSFE